MCTVVCRWGPDAPLAVLALRDEFVGRDFDEPGAWWPELPSVVGGRDRLAGGTWCASDVPTGRTALVVNRFERRDGTPSRGGLPLAALTHGRDWPDAVAYRDMAAFNLLLAGPDGVAMWVWDASALRRLDLAAGTHFVTSQGVDGGDPKSLRWRARFDTDDWRAVVSDASPSGDDDALTVRREHGGKTYATVFGQVITATAGALRIEHSRTPWQPDSWRTQTFS